MRRRANAARTPLARLPDMSTANQRSEAAAQQPSEEAAGRKKPASTKFTEKKPFVTGGRVPKTQNANPNSAPVPPTRQPRNPAAGRGAPSGRAIRVPVRAASQNPTPKPAFGEKQAFTPAPAVPPGHPRVPKLQLQRLQTPHAAPSRTCAQTPATGSAAGQSKVPRLALHNLKTPAPSVPSFGSGSASARAPRSARENAGTLPLTARAHRSGYKPLGSARHHEGAYWDVGGIGGQVTPRRPADIVLTQADSPRAMAGGSTARSQRPKQPKDIAPEESSPCGPSYTAHKPPARKRVAVHSHVITANPLAAIKVPSLPAHSSLDLSPILEQAGPQASAKPAASPERKNLPATDISKGDTCSAPKAEPLEIGGHTDEPSDKYVADTSAPEEDEQSSAALDLAASVLVAPSELVEEAPQEPPPPASTIAQPEQDSCTAAASLAAASAFERIGESLPVSLLIGNPLAETPALLEEPGHGGFQPPEWVWWTKTPTGGTPARLAGPDGDRLTDFGKPSPLRYKMQSLDSPGLSNEIIMQAMQVPAANKPFEELVPILSPTKGSEGVGHTPAAMATTPHAAKRSSLTASEGIEGAGTPLDFSDVFDIDSEGTPGLVRGHNWGTPEEEKAVKDWLETASPMASLQFSQVGRAGSPQVGTVALKDLDTPAAHRLLDQMRPRNPSANSSPANFASTPFQQGLARTLPALSPESAVKPDAAAVASAAVHANLAHSPAQEPADPATPAAAHLLSDLELSLPAAGGSDLLAASPFVAGLARSRPVLSPEASPAVGPNAPTDTAAPPKAAAAGSAPAVQASVEKEAALLEAAQLSSAAEQEGLGSPLPAAAQVSKPSESEVPGSPMAARSPGSRAVLQTPGTSPGAWSELWDSSPESTGAPSAVKPSPEPSVLAPAAVKAPSPSPKVAPRTLGRRLPPKSRFFRESAFPAPRAELCFADQAGDDSDNVCMGSPPQPARPSPAPQRDHSSTPQRSRLPTSAKRAVLGARAPSAGSDAGSPAKAVVRLATPVGLKPAPVSPASKKKKVQMPGSVDLAAGLRKSAASAVTPQFIPGALAPAPKAVSGQSSLQSTANDKLAPSVPAEASAPGAQPTVYQHLLAHLTKGSYQSPDGGEAAKTGPVPVSDSAPMAKETGSPGWTAPFGTPGVIPMLLGRSGSVESETPLATPVGSIALDADAETPQESMGSNSSTPAPQQALQEQHNLGSTTRPARVYASGNWLAKSKDAGREAAAVAEDAEGAAVYRQILAHLHKGTASKGAAEQQVAAKAQNQDPAADASAIPVSEAHAAERDQEGEATAGVLRDGAAEEVELVASLAARSPAVSSVGSGLSGDWEEAIFDDSDEDSVISSYDDSSAGSPRSPTATVSTCAGSASARDAFPSPSVSASTITVLASPATSAAFDSYQASPLSLTVSMTAPADFISPPEAFHAPTAASPRTGSVSLPASPMMSAPPNSPALSGISDGESASPAVAAWEDSGVALFISPGSPSREAAETESAEPVPMVMVVGVCSVDDAAEETSSWVSDTAVEAEEAGVYGSGPSVLSEMPAATSAAESGIEQADAMPPIAEAIADIVTSSSSQGSEAEGCPPVEPEASTSIDVPAEEQNTTLPSADVITNLVDSPSSQESKNDVHDSHASAGTEPETAAAAFSPPSSHSETASELSACHAELAQSPAAESAKQAQSPEQMQAAPASVPASLLKGTPLDRVLAMETPAAATTEGTAETPFFSPVEYTADCPETPAPSPAQLSVADASPAEQGSVDLGNLDDWLSRADLSGAVRSPARGYIQRLWRAAAEAADLCPEEATERREQLEKATDEAASYLARWDSEMHQGAALEDENEVLRTQLAVLQDQIQYLALEDPEASRVLAAAGEEEDALKAARCLLQLTDHAQLVSSAYEADKVNLEEELVSAQAHLQEAETANASAMNAAETTDSDLAHLQEQLAEARAHVEAAALACKAAEEAKAAAEQDASRLREQLLEAHAKLQAMSEHAAAERLPQSPALKGLASHLKEAAASVVKDLEGAPPAREPSLIAAPAEGEAAEAESAIAELEAQRSKELEVASVTRRICQRENDVLRADMEDAKAKLEALNVLSAKKSAAQQPPPGRSTTALTPVALQAHFLQVSSKATQAAEQGIRAEDVHTPRSQSPALSMALSAQCGLQAHAISPMTEVSVLDSPGVQFISSPAPRTPVNRLQVPLQSKPAVPAASSLRFFGHHRLFLAPRPEPETVPRTPVNQLRSAAVASPMGPRSPYAATLSKGASPVASPIWVSPVPLERWNLITERLRRLRTELQEAQSKLRGFDTLRTGRDAGGENQACADSSPTAAELELTKPAQPSAAANGITAAGQEPVQAENLHQPESGEISCAQEEAQSSGGLPARAVQAPLGGAESPAASQAGQQGAETPPRSEDLPPEAASTADQVPLEAAPSSAPSTDPNKPSSAFASPQQRSATPSPARHTPRGLKENSPPVSPHSSPGAKWPSAAKVGQTATMTTPKSLRTSSVRKSATPKKTSAAARTPQRRAGTPSSSGADTPRSRFSVSEALSPASPLISLGLFGAGGGPGVGLTIDIPPGAIEFPSLEGPSPTGLTPMLLGPAGFGSPAVKPLTAKLREGSSDSASPTGLTPTPKAGDGFTDASFSAGDGARRQADTSMSGSESHRRSTGLVATPKASQASAGFSNASSDSSVSTGKPPRPARGGCGQNTPTSRYQAPTVSSRLRSLGARASPVSPSSRSPGAAGTHVRGPSHVQDSPDDDVSPPMASTRHAAAYAWPQARARRGNRKATAEEEAEFRRRAAALNIRISPYFPRPVVRNAGRPEGQ